MNNYSLDALKGLPLILFDIDGTLANGDHRVHLAHIKAWDEYFEACDGDEPIPHMMALFKIMLASDDCAVMLVTGRPERIMKKTYEWLRREGVDTDTYIIPHYCRKDGDHRPDVVVKAEILQEIRDTLGAPPMLVFDDRTSVVKMWRDHGIPCCHVVSEEAGSF